MSKAHRGSGIRKEPYHGRGTCPVCKKERVKILWDQEIDGQKTKICKKCKAVFKNKAFKDARLTKKAATESAAAEEKVAEATSSQAEETPATEEAPAEA